MHCHGRATDYPDWLRALRHENPRVRQEARASLVRTLEHQDGVEQATPYAIPFLLELAGDPDTPDLQELLALLSHVFRAVAFQAERPLPDVAKLDFKIPLALWPEHSCDDADEVLLEEGETSYEDWRVWQALSLRAFQQGREVLAGVAQQSALARSILIELDAIGAG